jgi:hypothetical protein
MGLRDIEGMNINDHVLDKGSLRKRGAYGVMPYSERQKIKEDRERREMEGPSAGEELLGAGIQLVAPPILEAIEFYEDPSTASGLQLGAGVFLGRIKALGKLGKVFKKFFKKCKKKPNVSVIKKRKALGGDAAKSEHIIKKDAKGNTNSVTHKVTKDGEIIHQHETHVGKEGTQRQFPDEWTGTETK